MTISVTFNLAEVEALASSLQRASASTLGRAALQAVNAVSTRFDEKQRAGQVADLNLSPEYVLSKTALARATDEANPTATLTTTGRGELMTRYPVTVNRDPDRLDRAGRRLGNRPAGLTVSIKRSAPADEPQWFLMRLKGSGKLGTFVRTSANKLKHLYAPAPYQLFKHQIEVGTDDLLADLEATGIAAVVEAVELELSRK